MDSSNASNTDIIISSKHVKQQASQFELIIIWLIIAKKYITKNSSCKKLMRVKSKEKRFKQRSASNLKK